MVVVSAQEQNVRFLATQLQAIQNVKEHALYEKAQGQYEVIKLTWFHRLVRYFVPEWYDSVQHLPKLSSMILDVSKTNAAAIDYTNITERLEALLFTDISLQKGQLQSDTTKQKVIKANKAIESLLSLRDTFIKKPKPAFTLEPVLVAIKESNRWSHDEFCNALLPSLKAVVSKVRSGAVLSPSFGRELDELLAKSREFAKRLPGFWPRELAAILLQLQNLFSELKLPSHPQMAELQALYKIAVEKDISKKMQAVLQEPSKNPAELNWLFCDYSKIFGWEAFKAFIGQPELTSLRQGLCKKMQATLRVENQRVGKILIPIASLAQSSQPVSFERVAPEFQEMRPKLIQWTTLVPNYQAVCNTFQREELGATKIGQESLRTLLPAKVPDELKVPLLCEALLTKAKELLPSKEEGELKKMVAEAVSLVAIEDPNPISLPREFLGIYSYLSPVRNLLLTDNDQANHDIKTHFEFELKNDKGALSISYRTSRAFTLKEFRDSENSGLIRRDDVLFSVKIEKSFAKPDAAWVAMLRCQKQSG